MRVRKIPQRTCVGCGQVREKRQLLRIVRTPAGELAVDPTGKRSGRGAYICPVPECLELALKHRRLERALATPLGDAVVNLLRETLSGAAHG
jgi:predicted RNA-binding protein YlxR (DUF448 family)